MVVLQNYQPLLTSDDIIFPSSQKLCNRWQHHTKHYSHSQRYSPFWVWLYFVGPHSEQMPPPPSCFLNSTFPQTAFSLTIHITLSHIFGLCPLHISFPSQSKNTFWLQTEVGNRTLSIISVNSLTNANLNFHLVYFAGQHWYSAAVKMADSPTIVGTQKRTQPVYRFSGPGAHCGENTVPL